MHEPALRILLIEDNRADARLIDLLLEETSLDATTEHAEDLASGLERLRSGVFDAVLLDLSLPDSHGLETFRHTYAEARAVPIVVLSGLADEELAAEAVHAGAQDYLVKGQVDGRLLGRSLRYAIERKRSETALQEVNARFRTVYEENPLGMEVFDRELRILQANPAFCRMIGHTEEELLGRALPEITHPDDVAGDEETLIPLFHGEVESIRREKRYLTAGGRVIWASVTASAVRDASGVFLYGIGLVEDVTERREADERLRRQDQLLREAQQIAHLGSWEWDVVADRVVWSDELYRIYGLDPKRFGATFEAYLERVHPEDRELVRMTIERALRDRTPFGFDERIIRPDGSVRTLLSRGEIVVDEQGSIVRVIGACQDITERKQEELELERARDAAVRSARLKSAFLANMSHEIRTPLNIILGYVSVISETGADLEAESRSVLVRGITRAADRLMGTIGGILDISKMETGNFEVRPSCLHLRSLLERQIEDFTMLAREKGLALRLDVDGERDTMVSFDEYCLSHALMNLLQNAIKFTLGGDVTVRLWRDTDGTLSIDVRDTGIGIDSSYLPYLFEPFSQEDTGYTRRFEGSGLGLTLTKEYLERNGATISVDSRKGHGSVFRIRFPKGCEIERTPNDPTALDPPVTRSPEPERQKNRPTVLVVEDDEDTQKYMQELLGRYYRVLVAVSAEEARIQLARHPKEVLLILMDLSLRGDEDGLMLTAWLRRQPAWNRIPIIAATAHAFPEDRLRALEAGCNAYLAKPFRRAELFLLMEELLQPTGPTAPPECLH